MRVFLVILWTEIKLSSVKKIYKKYHEAMSKDFEHQVVAPENGKYGTYRFDAINRSQRASTGKIKKRFLMKLEMFRRK